MADPSIEEKELLDKITFSKDSFKFKPSYNEDRLDKFRMTNPTDSLISFKIKSTRLKQLGSKPSYGTLKPKRGVYVTVKFYKLTGEFDGNADHLTVYLGILPKDKENMKPSQFWRTAAPATTRRVVINVEYDPAIEGVPPAAGAEAPAPTPAAPPPAEGAPEKKEDEGEDEEGEEGE
ncbi:Major sperm protein [Trichuris trichiura]|uniref:Major sperm protein n=1 Tax=Trichuris trichiura TaxID=36087 RepID=A0A077ZFR0_TRITR|nr:Major sperm protein [Trichuris trichiura]